MDLHHLEYIVEIAKERNISKAAQNLHISQPTLSIYLSKLEQELNLKLFHRANNVLTITEAGQKYAKTCQQILDLKESLYKELYSDKNHVFCMGILSSDAAVLDVYKRQGMPSCSSCSFTSGEWLIMVDSIARSHAFDKISS